MVGVLSLITMIFLAGCTTQPTAPTVTSENVESSSAATETASSDFVDQSTPTADQTVPDLA